jgi:hypothetical protein
MPRTTCGSPAAARRTPISSKFTREGKFLQQFGKPGTNGGSADTRNLGQPANLTIDPVSNEIYVADGYRNRRVIVLDADTFAFKRMWGAYGNKPDDTPLGPYNPDAPPRSSSACRTTSPSRATASSTWPIGRTTASRCSGRTAPT